MEHLREKFQHLFGKNSPGLKYVLIAALVLALVLALRNVFVLALLLALTVVIAFLARVYNLRGYGLELTTLVTVLTGYTLGPSYGFGMGLISNALHMFISGNIDVYLIWVIPSYGLAGLAAALMSSNPIASVGIMLTIALHIIFFGFTIFMNPGNLGRFFVYVIFNVIFNLLLFTYVAPIILALLA